MAMPALEFEWELPVEERVGILEANIEHIRSDISEMKVDIRRLNDKVDGVEQRLTAKIDAVYQERSGKIESVKDCVASLALTVEKGFAELKVARALDRIWWLLQSAALLGIMARAFKWI